MFQPGDYVYPTDLPLRLLCRITQVESLNPGGEGFQVLKLTPLEGPWKAGAQLVRFASSVRPAPGWPHAPFSPSRSARTVELDLAGESHPDRPASGRGPCVA